LWSSKYLRPRRRLADEPSRNLSAGKVDDRDLDLLVAALELLLDVGLGHGDPCRSARPAASRDDAAADLVLELVGRIGGVCI
jgi:hypothetical protein